MITHDAILLQYVNVWHENPACSIQSLAQAISDTFSKVNEWLVVNDFLGDFLKSERKFSEKKIKMHWTLIKNLILANLYPTAQRKTKIVHNRVKQIHIFSLIFVFYTRTCFGRIWKQCRPSSDVACCRVLIVCIQKFLWKI